MCVFVYVCLSVCVFVCVCKRVYLCDVHVRVSMFIVCVSPPNMFETIQFRLKSSSQTIVCTVAICIAFTAGLCAS